MNRGFLTLACVTLMFTMMGCEDPDNICEGSLSAIYDLSFETVDARQTQASNVLVIRYSRTQGTGEELPIIISIYDATDLQLNQEYTFDNGDLNLDNSTLEGALLPTVENARTTLTAFTSNTSGSDVQGSLHANLTSGGTYSLTCRFKTTLRVLP